ncbi:MAG: hypothetical protein P9L91_09900 [Candidatus Zophobacter franzmannii]|nr:hypothetical protein [Candidatus Zophobacter franzmannii]
MKIGITELSNQIKARSNQDITGNDCRIIMIGCIKAENAFEKCIKKPKSVPATKAITNPIKALNKVAEIAT